MMMRVMMMMMMFVFIFKDVVEGSLHVTASIDTGCAAPWKVTQTRPILTRAVQHRGQSPHSSPPRAVQHRGQDASDLGGPPYEMELLGRRLGLRLQDRLIAVMALYIESRA